MVYSINDIMWLKKDGRYVASNLKVISTKYEYRKLGDKPCEDSEVHDIKYFRVVGYAKMAPSKDNFFHHTSHG